MNMQGVYTCIEGLSPQKPYISHPNESALQVLNLGGSSERSER